MKIAALSTGGALLSYFGLSKYLVRNARTYAGTIVGASANVGHLLRDGQLSPPSQIREVETVIVGGGVAGLSAAWWLKKNGYDNFALLELEPKVGGNSQSGENAISAYPWGAHYLPLPGPEAQYVRAFLQEVGVIKGYDQSGLPIYDEFHLCADPHERLYYQGRWHDGIIPQIGLSTDDRRQYDEFFSLIERYKVAVGHDGKRGFVIPVDMSSQDREFRDLDAITMAEFMRRHKWMSPQLNWYVNYCCRDDYGATYDTVSAYAGIHYFASRIGVGSNADSQTVLTWPQGNGWLVDRLREKSGEQILTNTLAYSIEQHDGFVSVDYLDTASKQTFRIKAKKVICAAPRFVASRIIKALGGSRPSYLNDLHYSPWMVANISLKKLPEGRGAGLSFENVSYHSKSLGYVVSTHQSLSRFRQKTVLTYYQDLSDTDPVTARRLAIQKTHQEWAKEVAADLGKMHPGIDEHIENIDIWLWGHGMAIPRPGFIWGQSRKEMQKPLGSVHFAHSDMSGVSIFEEAQYRGVAAAKAILSELKA
jgi:protoporphyrinogen oxidase